MKYLAVTLALFFCPLSLLADPETEPGDKVEESYWEQAKKMYEELISEDRNLKEESKQWLSDDISRVSGMMGHEGHLPKPSAPACLPRPTR